MRCLLFLLLAPAVLGQQQQQQEVHAVPQGFSEPVQQAYREQQGFEPTYHQVAPVQYGEWQTIQNRHGISSRAGFFDIAGSYATSLVVTFVFVTGAILVLDLALGNVNILQNLLGRSGRSLFESGKAAVENLDSDTVMGIAEKIYEAYEKYSDFVPVELPK